MTQTQRWGLAALAMSSAMVLAQQGGVDPRPPNATHQKPAFAGQTRAPEKRLDVAFDIVTVVEGLQNPWSIAFLPDGRMLVTERPGRLRVLGPTASCRRRSPDFPRLTPAARVGCST